MNHFNSKNITVVLGPTNTGKTHLAIERMTGYASGIIGFPLRLLARENYDRLVSKIGADKVALVTGEERIIPSDARYFCCTVESMPVKNNIDVCSTKTQFDFIAIDEIQLAGDYERGHVFTDRIMKARGVFETMLLGSETALPLLRALLPNARFEFRSRMSKLIYSGPRKLTRLKRRSAVVAFSAGDVYQIAEIVRRQRGGAAIVMGRLSPRTRNAQVEMYQNGDVDFLIATDAIGMGLNLDLSHVALSSQVKFDGHKKRKLLPAEIAQIAGRAGRHVNDGSFGVTDACPPLDVDTIEAIEYHRFEPLKSFYWRNSNLNFSSVRELLNSLEAPPPLPFLFRKRDALDHRAITALVEKASVRDMLAGPEEVKLLWSVASIPDFRQSLHENHYDMLAKLFVALAEEGSLSENIIADAMARLDRLDGDIDTLMTRLSYIRTWTYISQRSDWTDHPLEWQTRARKIEDDLSDCLHRRLSERFVDRRVAYLSRRLKEGNRLLASVKDQGVVFVEGQEVGALRGFVFYPNLDDGENKTAILAAARRALPEEIQRRVGAFVASANLAFKLNSEGIIRWREAEVAHLKKGDGLYSPRLELIESDLLSPEQGKQLSERLVLFVEEHLKGVLGGLLALGSPHSNYHLLKRSDKKMTELKTEKSKIDKVLDAAKEEPVGIIDECFEENLSGAAKGIAFSLFEMLGSVPTQALTSLIRALDDCDKSSLARLGVRFGVETVYMPEILKPAQIELRSLLYLLYNGRSSAGTPPPAGRVAIDAVNEVSDEYWLAVGYRRLGNRIMRVDMVERVAMLVREAARGGAFKITDDMLSLAGATREQMGLVLSDLGCVVVGEEPSEDQEKPPVKIFERKLKNRERKNVKFGRVTTNSNKPAHAKLKGGGKENFGKTGNKSFRKSVQNKQVNPNSPFAVLATLKKKT